MNFFNNLNLNIEKAYDVSKNLIIVGDLNEDLLNPNFHNFGSGEEAKKKKRFSKWPQRPSRNSERNDFSYF